jgi:hypothetical protein
MPQFYKLLNEQMCHHGFQYVSGLNIDHLPFKPEGQCQAGGLFFTDVEHIRIWMRDEWPLIADVTLPFDALVYPEPCGTKWKADRLVLSNIRLFRDFLNEQPDTVLLTIMRDREREIFTQLKAPSTAVCLAAVSAWGYLLHRVPKQTDEICLAAVKQHWMALSLVQRPTAEMRQAAVAQCGFALQWVPAEDQTPALCYAAMRNCPSAELFVKIKL